MKKCILLLTLVIFTYAQSLQAQSTDSLDINNIRAALIPSGNLFSNENGFGKFIVKDSVNRSAISFGGLWIGAMDSAQNLKTSAVKYSGGDFRFGPITTDTARYTDSVYLKKYWRLWKVTKAEVDKHRLRAGTLGYFPSQAILDWPAHGDTTRGEPWHLAPFQDFNGNKQYEPFLGDYPLIRGDEAVYAIFNDVAFNFFPRVDSKLGVEVHLLAYAFDAPINDALNNTIFLNYRIINRVQNYSAFRVAHWTDFDLGNPDDDILGSDSIKSYGFCYNADADDEGPRGFGLNPPAVACVSLNKRFAGAIGQRNAGLGSPSPNTTDPRNALHYWNYLNHRWKDGTPLVRENPSGCGQLSNGDGYDVTGNFSQTNWMYDLNENWYHSSASSGDQRLAMTQEEVSLSIGQELVYDIAYVYARSAMASNPCQTLATLDSSVTAVKDYFTAQNFPCLGCNVGLASTPTFKAQLFPNPFTDAFRVKTEMEIVTANLYNSAGQKVYSAEFKGDKEVEITPPVHLNSGLYILTLVDKFGRLFSMKIQKS